MRNFSPKTLSMTMGITTCFGAESILTTVKSIRASRGVGKFRFIIVADSVPFSPSLKKKLKSYQVELIANKISGSQIKKQEQIIKMCRTDLIIFTQDDVLFAPDTIAKIAAAFKRRPQTTFISIANKAIESRSWLENAIGIGTEISQKIARNWNHGDNYLAVIGRVEAFRTDFIAKRFRFIDGLVSGDAYFYFENKRRGGRYQYLPAAKVYFKNPDNLAEHLRKSSRFQHSYRELSPYFDNIEREYVIPKRAILKALVWQLWAKPISTLLYFSIYLYTRWSKLKPKTALNPLWEVDLSTKKL